ncbi:MAG: tol-pal system protein YbgF [Pseudomonadota bacterium]
MADIRQELQFVLGEIQTLRRELSTTGGAGLPTNTGPALARIDALEAEVRRLTGEIEEKTFAIESIVKDGTNRIGDLEFRLCELESGCDVTALSRTAPLGGQGLTRPTGPAAPTVPGDEKAPETAGATDSERASFERAMAALEAQNFAAAAGQFAALTENFPGGPLTGEADYWRGVALAGAGDWSNAARAFLESFSGSPEGVKAPEALYRLGLSLNELGQREEACLMLSEVSLRYPTASVGTQAQADFATLSCG